MVLIHQEKTVKALPGTTTDLPNGEAGEVQNTVIELPVSMVQTLQAMVTNSQPQCNIANVLVQNGLTTNQVVSDHKQVVSSTCHTLHYSWVLLYTPSSPGAWICLELYHFT